MSELSEIKDTLNHVVNAVKEIQETLKEHTKRFDDIDRELETIINSQDAQTTILQLHSAALEITKR